LDNTLYLMASRMNSLGDNLQVIAANLANASTPGFKRTVGRFQAVLQSITPSAQLQPTMPLLYWPELSAFCQDFSQGPISMTGRPLDLAVRGSAFFVVDTPEGQLYTRKGRIYLNEAGELTDGGGNRFASEGGTLRIPNDAVQIVIDKNGSVVADGRVLGQLRLVDIADTSALVAQGEGLYAYHAPTPAKAVDSEVIQGAVEESNVKAVHEMVAMMELMQAYDASARVVKRMDGLSKELIQNAA